MSAVVAASMISALVLSLVPVPGDMLVVDVLTGEPIPGATVSAVPEAMAPICSERWARCGSSPVELGERTRSIPQYEAIESAHVVHARRRQAALVKAAEHGVEPGSAGLHIVDPPRDREHYDSDVWGVPHSQWLWTSTIAQYPRLPAFPGDDTPEAVPTATERVIPNAAVELRKITTAEGWGIEADLDERALDLLAATHGPKEQPAPFTDWLGATVDAGGTASVMQVALVYENVALLPFDASALVGTTGSRTVLLARDLSEARVDELIAKFARGQ